MSGESYKKRVHLRMSDREEVRRMAHALSSSLRLEILSLLENRSMNVGELAAALDIPVSTAAVNVEVLQEAGLISVERIPGARGLMKRCRKVTDSIDVDLRQADLVQARTGQISMPVGCYTDACDIRPSCGLADARDFIGGVQDDPALFQLPGHFGAQILWFRQGSVEYRFPASMLQSGAVCYLEFVFEACSETLGYDNNYPSDIFVAVNGVELGLWTSPGDFGGRRGLRNPAWWANTNTQYGMLNTWRVTPSGTFLGNRMVSAVSLENLHLEEKDYLTFRIGVHPDARHMGGLNLFGENFGDTPHGILMNYSIS